MAVRLKPGAVLLETMQRPAMVRPAVVATLALVACTLQGCEESNLDLALDVSFSMFGMAG